MTTTAGPPVPFDSELAAALDVIRDRLPALTIDMLPMIRAARAAMPGLSDEELSMDGALDVSERLVPGPDGAPDVSLLIFRPTAATTAVPVIYTIHGGGMIMGSNRGEGAVGVI